MGSLGQIFTAALRRFARDEGASATVLFAALVIAALGAGAIAIDIGRLALLRSQLQNYADAAAMAGAAQLDGRVGAQSRATSVATNAAQADSTMSAGTQTLAVQSVQFYSALSPDYVAATSDADSRYIQVTLEPRRVNFYLAPLLSAFTGMTGDTLNVHATAGSNPFICHAPPLMICDPSELDSSLNLSDPANVGRQVLLKPPPGGGSWTPGNYGLLALPDGSQGADDIEGALAAVSPPECYTLDVSTAPGVKTSKVQDGVNARFDLPSTPPYPAPNVINYPRDPEIDGSTSTVMGSGNWDLSGYWLAKHAGSVPTALDGASRYQVYLYELGLQFARNGKQTLYPVPSTLPSGYVLVTPPGKDIPTDPANPTNPDYDGVPDTTPVASNGYARRLIQVAVLQCIADNVSGSHTYPTNGNYVEMFITEQVRDTPAGGIYAEIVQPLNPDNHPDFHANVSLAQ